jgi:UDP-N-acetylglucosamine pyrophosphorylase
MTRKTQTLKKVKSQNKSKSQLRKTRKVLKMDNTSPVINFYLSSSVIAAAEFAAESYEHYDEDDSLYPYFSDVFQAYAQRHH